MKIKDFFGKCKAWIINHKILSIIIGASTVIVVTLAIVLPIAITSSKKKNDNSSSGQITSDEADSEEDPTSFDYQELADICNGLKKKSYALKLTRTLEKEGAPNPDPTYGYLEAYRGFYRFGEGGIEEETHNLSDNVFEYSPTYWYTLEYYKVDEHNWYVDALPQSVLSVTSNEFSYMYDAAKWTGFTKEGNIITYLEEDEFYKTVISYTIDGQGFLTEYKHVFCWKEDHEVETLTFEVVSLTEKPFELPVVDNIGFVKEALFYIKYFIDRESFTYAYEAYEFDNGERDQEPYYSTEGKYAFYSVGFMLEIGLSQGYNREYYYEDDNLDIRHIYHSDSTWRNVIDTSVHGSLDPGMGIYTQLMDSLLVGHGITNPVFSELDDSNIQFAYTIEERQTTIIVDISSNYICDVSYIEWADFIHYSISDVGETEIDDFPDMSF